MLPPGLSMLWETVAPEAALQDRFGFDGLGSAVEWVSRTLADAWGQTIWDCTRLVISDRNAIIWVGSTLGPLVVKCSCAPDRFEGLAVSATLLHRLGRQGLPVAAPLEARDGRVRVEQKGPLGALSVAVLPEIEGGWLDVEDDGAVRAAGACLADLHRALGGISDLRLTPVPTTSALRGQVAHWLAGGDRGLAPSASSRLKDLVADLPELDDEVQLVHNDFRAANLLTKDAQIVAVLDFDEITWDHRVIDVAKASVYLGTRFTDWGPTPLAVRQEFRTGYESVRPLPSAESKWLEALTLWFGIRAIPGAIDPAGWADAL